jgi:hypothetical protein
MKDEDCYDWTGCPDGDCENCDVSPAGDKYIDGAPKLTKWLEDIEEARLSGRHINDPCTVHSLRVLREVIREMAHEVSKLIGEKS